MRLALILGLTAALSVGASQAWPAASPATTSALAKLKIAPGDYYECLNRFAAVGLPRHVSAAADAEQAVPLVCRPSYALSFNTVTRNPDWVIELLDKNSVTGSAARKDNFRKDPWMPASPGKSDYAGQYDRGHQAPAADAKYSQQAMDDSFYMTNMSPQVGPRFNRGQWAQVEDTVRDWVLCGRTRIIVITGPIYGVVAKRIGPAKDIAVPESYYKIVYDLTSGRALGLRLKNEGQDAQAISKFVVPIRQIENDTGLDFFANLPKRRQNQLEIPKGVAWGHDTCS